MGMDFYYAGISSIFPIDLATTSKVHFYDQNCLDPVDPSSSTTYDDTYFTAITFERAAGTDIPTLTFTMVPEEIKLQPALYQSGNYGSIMAYCVRMGLYTDGGEEVNFLETIVNITVSFDGTFDTGDISLIPKDKTTTGSTKAYTVAAALCAGFVPPFQQGQVLSVCIVPDGDAIADGIKLTNIDSFTWTRAGVTPQEAVKKDGSGAAFDALSAVEMNPNGSSIVVSSVLYATFFAEDGTVSATGNVQLGFARRRLGESDERRKLQEEGVPPAGFDVNTQVIKATDGPATLQTAGGASPSLGFVGTVLGLVSAVLLA